jgi:hypothetical protein
MSLNHATGPDVDSIALAARAAAELGGERGAGGVLRVILPAVDVARPPEESVGMDELGGAVLVAGMMGADPEAVLGLLGGASNLGNEAAERASDLSIGE